MGSQRERGWGKPSRWLRRAGLAACLAGCLGLPLLGQPPADEPVNPLRITELAGRLDGLDAGGKSAVLDYFVEAANKPSDRLADNYSLQVALRAAGPQLARLADGAKGKLRLQAIAALGQTRANSETLLPVWEAALAEKNPATDEAVGAGLLGYLKRGQLIKDSVGMQARLGFIDAALTDLMGVAPLLPRLQKSASPAARKNVYDGMAGFFDVLENIAPELRGEANPQAFASYKRQLPLLPGKLAGFFASAERSLGAAPPDETRANLDSLEKIAEVCLSRDDFLQVKSPRRPVGRLLQPDLEPQGREAAKLLTAELKKLLPAIAARLKAPDLQVRLAATHVLESLAGEAVPELPRLMAALEDPNPFVRWAMVRTLGKMSFSHATETAPIVQALIPRLQDEDLGVRAVTAIALEQFGEKAAPAAAALGEMAKAQDAALQLAAVRALAAVGPAAKDGLAGLDAALASQEERVREQAAMILAKLGPAAAASVPALREALKDSSSNVRLRAAEALVRIEAPNVKP